MSDDLVNRLSCLHKAATPAKLETAEIKEGQDWFSCPHCDGVGEVEAEQFINYDGVAANVLFSGIGHEFGDNRDWYMEITHAWPSVAAEITALRARLEQAERERDEWRIVATKTNHLAEDLARRAGFRAGIEAAAKEALETASEGKMMGDNHGYQVSIRTASCIRALSLADNTTTVAAAAKVLLDFTKDREFQRIIDKVNEVKRRSFQGEFHCALRALAEQKDGEQ